MTRNTPFFGLAAGVFAALLCGPLAAQQTLTSTGALNFYQVHKASGPIKLV